VKKPAQARRRKPQSDAQAGPQASAPPDGFTSLLRRAEALAPGDETGLKTLLSDVAHDKFSEARADPVLRAAAKATKISLGIAKNLFGRAAAELRRKQKSSPDTQKAARLVRQTERDVERARLWEACKSVAMSKTLLPDMQVVAHRLGVVSEDASIAGAYLACTSRLLKRRAISYLRRGASAAGKNHLLAMVLKLFPEESILPISSATPMALIYYRGSETEGAEIDSDEGDEQALAHKIIVIAEAAILSRKANGDEHPLTAMLRILLSEGKLDHHIPLPSGKGGTPKTVHLIRHGPVVLLMTSAREDVEPEMMTRLLSADADESGEQTRDVVKNILTPSFAPADPNGVAQWVALQKWLESDAPYEVAVPFLEALSDAYIQLIEDFPATLQLRMRRDVTALVTAVEASALLHRAQRKTDGEGRIIAELDDYRHAYAAYNEGMAALYDLRPADAIRAALGAVITIAEEAENAGVTNPDDYRQHETEKSYRVSVEAVRRKLGVASKETAAQRLNKLVDFGFIEEDESRRGKGRGAPRFYRILAKAMGAQTPSVFPHPDEVAKKHEGREGSESAVRKGQNVRNDDGATPFRTSRPFRTASFDPSLPLNSSTHRGAKTRGNARKSSGLSHLTAEERIAAVRGAGGTLPLWPDGTGFDTDLRSVSDATLAGILLDAVSDDYDAVLAVLRGEARLPLEQAEVRP
jgi:hypothetical protein